MRRSVQDCGPRTACNEQGDSSCGSATPKFSVTTKPDLADEDYSDLAKLVREAITNERYFLSPRMKRLKSLLSKLDPASTERTVTPYPPPRPSAEPSLLYRKLRGGGRRR
jgi:hypothetical protein